VTLSLYFILLTQKVRFDGIFRLIRIAGKLHGQRAQNGTGARTHLCSVIIWSLTTPISIRLSKFECTRIRKHDDFSMRILTGPQRIQNIACASSAAHFTSEKIIYAEKRLSLRTGNATNFFPSSFLFAVGPGIEK
jgi:hypothetical protein